MGSLRKIAASISEGHVCPACANNVCSATYVYRKPADDLEAHIFSCSSCSLSFARPVLIPELEDRQMDSLDDAEMYGSQMMKFLHEQLYIKKEISTIRKLGFNSASVLDVGCGAGWVSNIWARHGFDVTGLEPSVARGDVASEKYGLKVINGYVENVEIDRSFDIAILRHVIEHFFDPCAVLKKVRGLLKDDGVVVVIVPNIDCIGRYLFGVDWEWVLPWHCNFFNKSSLKSLVENSGFEVVKSYQTASPFYYFESLTRKLDSKLLQTLGNRFKVATMLTTSPLALFGLAMGLGDNLTVVARCR